MKRRRGSRRGKLQKTFIWMGAVGFLMSIGAFLLVTFRVEPNLEEVAGIRAEVVVSRTINKALTQQFAGEENTGKLFVSETGEDGRLKMVQADAMAINVLMSELSMSLQESFGKMESEEYDVPAGALLGSKLLSQAGPQVTVKIVPLSVSSMDFRTEFESQGINQTKYKIYIDLACRVKVLAPFSSADIDTSNTVLIAETVILGDVPNSYVQVPEEDVLDVVEE